MHFPPGTVIGRYELQSPLGAGGMGEVYLARDTALGRAVALKIFRPEGPEGVRRVRRFVQEARAASQVSHPNITHIYEVTELPDLSLIAMEYVDGQTLHRRLTREPMDLREVVAVALQVAAALEAAHGCGVIHRDIKSENIMISRRGYVKVLDFGLAKIAEPEAGADDHAAPTVSQPLTNPGVVMGTVSYMSPEQARGVAIDARTDIWSFGVVLYEMVAGRPPFDAATSGDMIASILYREPPALARFSPETPEALEWIISKALMKNREERYQTAREMLADLKKLQRQLDAADAATPAPGDEWGAAAPSAATNGIGARLLARNGSGSALTDESGPARETSGAGDGRLGSRRRRAGSRAFVAALAAAATLSLGAAGLWLFPRLFPARLEPPPQQSPPRQHTLSRLAFDSDLRRGRATLQSGPAWSPDGRFVAYASNRGADDFNIWVQQADGGNPARVTNSPHHDWQPDWSPDGKLIAFRSEREEASGIFVVPALGGMERRLTGFGYRPRWSPDGSKVLFLDWGDRVFDYPRVFVKELGDAPPAEVPTDVEGLLGSKQGAAAWHPDGQRVSFISGKGDFWTVRIDGAGAPVKSEVSDEVREQLRQAEIDFVDFVWAPDGDAFYLVGESRGVSDIWRMSVEPETLRWVGGPERVTTGLGHIADLALSRDGARMAFSIVERKTRIWMYPFDGRRGTLKAEGPPVALTDESLDPQFCDLTRDGARLVFAARRQGLGRQELWVKSLGDGSETMLQSDDGARFFPRWAPDGERLIYSRFKSPARQGGKRSGQIVLLATPGGEEQLVTSPGPWHDHVYDWAPDGEWVIGSTNRRSGDRWEVCMFPLAAAPRAEESMRVVASDPRRSLWAPTFSPDGRWVAYVSQENSGAKDSVVHVVPAAGGSPVALTAPGAWCDWPRWSQDGRTVYFVANYKSSFFSVWGVSFDPATGSAAGPPFRVTDFGSPSHMISPGLPYGEMALTEKHLALPVTDLSGSVWVLGNLSK